MHIDTDEHVAERVEIHFLAALVDELMKTLHAHHILSREQLQEIEDAVSDRLGTAPRAW
jgi:hypothetical protein